MDTVDAILRYSTHPATSGPDLTGYPADVTAVIAAVCELWKLTPPRTKSSKAYWIQQARELQDACGEFSAYELLDVVHNDWMQAMKRNKETTGWGCAPYVVEGPGSLVKVARATAALFRQQAGEAADDRRRYVEGPYSQFIEH